MDTASPANTTLVFDLDGTLVDTAPDLLRSLNHVLAKAGCAPRRLEEVYPLIGFGARRMIVDGLAASDSSREREEVNELLALFLEHYADHVAVDSRPYPGAVAALERAKRSGMRLGVCTNKYASLTHQLLAALEMDRLFHAVAGRDTFAVHKPDPGHLTGVVDLAGGARERAVMIGDSATDVKTARAADVPVIAVSFGYTDIPAAELDADRVIDDYAGLPEAALAALHAPI